jgi:hypothetical protein
MDDVLILLTTSAAAIIGARHHPPAPSLGMSAFGSSKDALNDPHGGASLPKVVNQVRGSFPKVAGRNLPVRFPPRRSRSCWYSWGRLLTVRFMDRWREAAELLTRPFRTLAFHAADDHCKIQVFGS